MSEYASKTIVKHNVPRNVLAMNHHMLAVGRSGAGKSNLCEYIICQRVGKEKCLDIYDDGKWENACYLLPEDDAFALKESRTFSNGTTTKFTHAYPTDYILFAGSLIASSSGSK